MGLRFHKSFKIAPGVKVNLNKKSAGVTLGTKGAHYTINTSGRRTASVGIPGTGLSYSTSTNGKKKGAKRTSSKKAAINKWIGIIIAIIAIVCVAGALKDNFAKKADAPAQSAITAQAPADKTAANSVSAAANTDSAAAASTSSTTADTQTKVWISESGTKYHTKSDCSGMENATEVTLQEALDAGKEACKRCD